MAYEDDQLMFCKAQSLVAVPVGTVLSDKSIYMGNAQVVPGYTTAAPVNDKGRGTPKRISVKVVETFLSSGAHTCFVELVMADNDALTTNLKVLKQTPLIGKAQLVKGYEFRLSYMPVGISKKWLGLRFNIGTEVLTAGKVTAGIKESESESTFVGDQG